MSYQLEISRSALKALAALPIDTRRRLGEHIETLAENPRSPGAQQLKGSFRGLYKLRVGDYRIIYQVDAQARVVRILRVGHRRNVYK